MMCNTNNMNVQNAVNVNANCRNVLRNSLLNLAGLGLGQNQQNWQLSSNSLLQNTSK